MQLLNNPFPHVVAVDFFNKQELELIQQELKFLFSPRKMQQPGVHHGSSAQTLSKAICLEMAYKIPDMSDILCVTKKTLDPPFVNTICNQWPAFLRLKYINQITTKVRYYHDTEGYEPHTDILHDYLAFMYFHTTPKKFKGGELYFPQYDYQIECNHNTMVLIPSYVEHGVRPVSVKDVDYWGGQGRYCISQFMDAKPITHV